MIAFPNTVAEVLAALGADAEIRAGGTDYQERAEAGLVAARVVDLDALAGLDGIERGAHETTIGARVRLASIAADPHVVAELPCLAKATGALATPEIRAAASLGGNLLQRSRCWYYRGPDARCLKSGGEGCLARDGDHHFASLVDLGPCIAPHPSTVGMALLAYDAVAVVAGADDRSIAALYGDGSDGTRDHRLEPGALLTHVRVPRAELPERGGYCRAIARARAEWPLVEVSARLGLDGERVAYARVAIGGVAPVPLRLRGVEAALEGLAPSEPAFEAAAAHALGDLGPRAGTLPMTRYKAALVATAVADALRDAWGQA